MQFLGWNHSGTGEIGEGEKIRSLSVNPIDATFLGLVLILGCYATYRLWDVVFTKMVEAFRYAVHTAWEYCRFLFILSIKLSVFTFVAGVIVDFLNGLGWLDFITTTQHWKEIELVISSSITVKYFLRHIVGFSAIKVPLQLLSNYVL